MSYNIQLKSEKQTAQLAHLFEAYLKAGDVIALVGVIGAGKTHFTRSLISKLLEAENRLEDIPSPSFSLVQIYETKSFDIWHCDLYRLNSVDEVFELGLQVAFDTALVIVEWPEKLGDQLPDDALIIKFEISINDNHRNLVFESKDPDWFKRIKNIKDRFEDA